MDKDKVNINILENYILILSNHTAPIKDIFLILKQKPHQEEDEKKQKELVIFKDQPEKQHNTHYSYTQELALKQISSNEYIFSLSQIKKIISPTYIEVIVFFSDRSWWRGERKIGKE